MGGDARKQIPWRPLKLERAMALPVMVKRQIEIFIKNLESLENYLEEINKEVYLIGRKYEVQIEILTSIKGISPFIALALIADIVDISRFAKDA
jgi:transposase